MNSMYAVIQDQNGHLGHQAIGQALVEADLDASLTKLALRRKLEPLCTFTVYSSKQATEAIQELEELGDVDVDPRDFDPQWFDPVECIAIIESLLESRARCVAEGVRTELALLRRVLTEAAHRRSTFHLVEVESESEIGCDKVLLAESSNRPSNTSSSDRSAGSSFFNLESAFKVGCCFPRPVNSNRWVLT